jgi:hypothetical protein
VLTCKGLDSRRIGHAHDEERCSHSPRRLALNKTDLQSALLNSDPREALDAISAFLLASARRFQPNREFSQSLYESANVLDYTRIVGDRTLPSIT